MPISAASLPSAPAFVASAYRAAAALPDLASRVTSALVDHNDRARPLWYRAFTLAQMALVASKFAGPATAAVVPVAATLAFLAAKTVCDTPAMRNVVAVHSLHATVNVAKYLLAQDGMLGRSAQVVVAQAFTVLLYETNNISAAAGLLQMISAHPGVMDELKEVAAEHGLPLLHTMLDATRWCVSRTGEWAGGQLRDVLLTGLVTRQGGMPDDMA